MSLRDLTIILLGLGIIVNALTILTLKNNQSSDLTERIQCLEQGRIYVGHHFCAGSDDTNLRTLLNSVK